MGTPHNYFRLLYVTFTPFGAHMIQLLMYILVWEHWEQKVT